MTSSGLLSRSFGYAASSWLTLVDGTEDAVALAPSRAVSTTSFQPIRLAKFVSRSSSLPELRGGRVHGLEAERAQAGGPGWERERVVERSERDPPAVEP